MVVNQVHGFRVCHVLSKSDAIVRLLLIRGILLLLSTFLIFLGFHHLLSRLWLPCQIIRIASNRFRQSGHCLLFLRLWLLVWKSWTFWNCSFSSPIFTSEEHLLFFSFLLFFHCACLLYFVQIRMHTLRLILFPCNNGFNMFVISVNVRFEKSLFLLQFFQFSFLLFY